MGNYSLFSKHFIVLSFVCIKISVKPCQTDESSGLLLLYIIHSTSLLPREAMLSFYFPLNFNDKGIVILQQSKTRYMSAQHWWKMLRLQTNNQSAQFRDSYCQSELSSWCSRAMCPGGASVGECSGWGLPPLPKQLRCW